ncbi:hypothetical protein L7F22_030361 [Adiantum nelumboides]|nr:hypothetical protein [Adiantum nelumboides]
MAPDQSPSRIHSWEDSATYSAQIAKSRLSPGPIDPHDDDDPKQVTPIVIRRYLLGSELDSADDVDSPKRLLSTAFPRENVLSFFYPHFLTDVSQKAEPEEDAQEREQKQREELGKRQMRRDVFLLAFAAVQSLPPSDRWSFYQIAGIHGWPHEPYDGAKGTYWDSKRYGWWGGYCQHGSPLFPTWHRPYTMLLEQSVIRQAKLLSESLSDPDEKCEVVAMADNLRLPYWDWAGPTGRTLGLPDIFVVNTVSLAYPWQSTFLQQRMSIPNPLKSFVLPKNVGTPISSSDFYNPSAKPNYEIPGGTPFIPLGYPTVRHVSAAYTTQSDKLNLTLLRSAETTLVEGVRGLFNINSWLPFSNHYWSSNTDLEEYGHYSSIELVHDMVHDIVGGPGGQMSYPEIASFDPIFFFHHCNVDRLVALWQYCYPKSWIPNPCPQPDITGTYTEQPDTAVTSSTDLTPFRCTSTDFVSSDDVRIVDRHCGYSYPELVLARKKKWTPAEMLDYMLRLYAPPQHFRHAWFLLLERIDKNAFNGSYSIRVFLDLPDANCHTPTTSPHYAGAISVFARESSGLNNGRRLMAATICINCLEHDKLRASLELTKTMSRLGITTAPEMSGDDGSVQPPEFNPLEAEGAIKLVYVKPNSDSLPPPKVPPKLTVVYQERVPDEETYEYLRPLVSDDVDVDVDVDGDVDVDVDVDAILNQTYDLPKSVIRYFPLATNYPPLRHLHMYTDR